MVDGLFQDVRFGVRMIAKHPMSSAVTILTLTLGIGLDAGVFTLLDGMVFRPRVAHDAASFVEVRTAALMSVDEYDAFRQAPSMRELSAWTPVHASVDGTPMLPLLVTCNFFMVYAPAQPIVGRVFRADDCVSPDRGRIAVIGENFWRMHFSADPSIVGRALTLNARRVTIIGVVPAGYDGELRSPIWVPYTMASAFFGGRDLLRERATPWLLGLTGRMASGATRASVRAELQVIAARTFPSATPATVDVSDGSMIQAPAIRAMAVWIVPTVMGALTMVLVIACLNVAILMLARAHARQREIATRLAIGASRGRLLRMLLVETMMLAVAAAVPSAFLADRFPSVVHLMVPTMPYYPADVNRAAVLYIGGVALLSGILAGIAPAMESLNANRWRSTRGLVATQVAMSFVLLVIATMFVRSEQRLAGRGPGYETDHLLVALPRIDVPPYTPVTAAAFYRNLRQTLEAQPGVRSVAYSDSLGPDEGVVPPTMQVVSEVSGRTTTADLHRMSSTFLATIGLPMVRGEVFRDEDASGVVTPVVVSESLARALWPDRDPVGQRLHGDAARLEVVGVVRDTPSMFGRNPRTIYRPAVRVQSGDALFVRFDGNARDVAARMRTAVEALDPNAVTEPRTLTSIRDDLAARFMRLVDVVLFLAVVSFALAVVGVYGAVAFSVSRRTKEIGIRVALGASASTVVALVLRQSIRLCAIGLGFGCLLALGVARIFAANIVRLETFEPMAFVGGALLVLVCCIAASYVPARRAGTVDPVEALRGD